MGKKWHCLVKYCCTCPSLSCHPSCCVSVPSTCSWPKTCREKIIACFNWILYALLNWVTIIPQCIPSCCGGPIIEWTSLHNEHIDKYIYIFSHLWIKSCLTRLVHKGWTGLSGVTHWVRVAWGCAVDTPVLHTHTRRIPELTHHHGNSTNERRDGSVSGSLPVCLLLCKSRKITMHLRHHVLFSC